MIWENRVPRAIGPAGAVGPSGQFASAFSINEAGVVGGRSTGVGGWVLDGDTLSFLSGDGAPSAINNAGALAGTARVSSLFGYQPAFWASAAAAAPVFFGNPGVPAAAAALDDRGQVVGSVGSPPRPQVFQGSGGAGQLPTIPGGFFLEYGNAYGLNERGETVGSLWVAESPSEVIGQRAVRWKDGVAVDLDTLLSPADAAAFLLAEALDVNERGQIVGFGYELPLGDDYEPRAFLLTPRCAAD